MQYLVMGHSGDRQALALSVQRYKPGSIVCGSYGSLSPSASTCRPILDSMPAGYSRVGFGPAGGEGVLLDVPKVFSSRKY